MTSSLPSSAHPLPLDSTYAAEMFGRMARQPQGAAPSPDPEAVVEAVLRRFMGQDEAIGLLAGPGQPLRAGPTPGAALALGSRQAPQALRDLASRLMDEGVLLARANPRQAPAMAGAIVGALKEAASEAGVKTDQDILAGGAAFFELAKTAGFALSGADEPTPLTEATLDFSNEHWTPKGLLFWDDPLVALMSKVRNASPSGVLLEFEKESQRRALAQLAQLEQTQRLASASSLAKTAEPRSAMIDALLQMGANPNELSDNAGAPKDVAAQLIKSGARLAGPGEPAAAQDSRPSLVSFLIQSDADLHEPSGEAGPTIAAQDVMAELIKSASRRHIGRPEAPDTPLMALLRQTPSERARTSSADLQAALQEAQERLDPAIVIAPGAVPPGLSPKDELMVYQSGILGGFGALLAARRNAANAVKALISDSAAGMAERSNAGGEPQKASPPPAGSLADRLIEQRKAAGPSASELGSANVKRRSLGE